MWTMRLAASGAGTQQHALLLRERDPDVARRVLDRATSSTSMVGRRALYFALAPTLASRGTMQLDLLAVAITTAERSRTSADATSPSGVLLGLGAAAKLYPALFIIPFVAGRFRGPRTRPRDPSRLGRRGHLDRGQPPVRARRDDAAGWSSSATTSRARPTGTACGTRRASSPPGRGARTRAWSTSAPSCCSSRGSWRSCGRSRPGASPASRDGRSGSRSSCVFLLTNKVYSPQYSVWLLAVVRARAPQPAAVHRVRGQRRGRVPDASSGGSALLDGRHSGLRGHPDLGAFELAIFVRAVILVLCVIEWIRRREPLARTRTAAADRRRGARTSRVRRHEDRTRAPHRGRPAPTSRTGTDGARASGSSEPSASVSLAFVGPPRRDVP